MKKINWIILLLCACSIVSCRKKELPAPVVTPPTSTTGTVKIQMKNVVGNKPMVLTDSSYVAPNGDTFSVSVYNYYLSNFVFVDEHGNRFVEPESYHLIMAGTPESLSFTVNGLPFEHYKSVEFLIGVDSARNSSGAQVGALDPKNGMIWSWSTGYIMAKMEGLSPQANSPGNILSYHIAGYKGAYDVLQKVKLDFPQNAVIAKDKTPTIYLQSDLISWFSSFTFPGFFKMPSVGSEGSAAFNISQSYSTMMSVTSVTNP